MAAWQQIPGAPVGSLGAGLPVDDKSIVMYAKKQVGQGREQGARLAFTQCQFTDGLMRSEQIAHPVAEGAPTDGLGDKVGSSRLIGLLYGGEIIEPGGHGDGEVATPWMLTQF